MTDFFIELVRRNSCLYDYTSKDYKDGHRILNIWMKIAKELEKEWLATPAEWKGTFLCVAQSKTFHVLRAIYMFYLDRAVTS